MTRHEKRAARSAEHAIDREIERMRHTDRLVRERPFGAARIAKHPGRALWGGKSGSNLNGYAPWSGRAGRTTTVRLAN
jgi:hypothetical protein